MEQVIVWLIAFLFWSACLLFAYFKGKGKKEDWYYFERFFHYSGIKYVSSKFITTQKEPVPTGVVWLFGLYFAAYAFTAQRYESQLDKIEFRYSTFTTQVAAGATFVNKRLMGILHEETPVKPSVYNPIKVFQSFVYKPQNFFYQTYSDEKKESYKTAAAFQQEIITQWDKKLDGANFRGLQLDEAKFIRANLNMADFLGAQIEGADFRWAKLVAANFIEAELKMADFRGAQLDGAGFIEAQLEGADFRMAQLDEAIFFGAQFLTAKQLIQANSITGIEYCPDEVLFEIIKLGCEEMILKSPDQWSEEFKNYRENLLKKWEEEDFLNKTNESTK